MSLEEKVQAKIDEIESQELCKIKLVLNNHTPVPSLRPRKGQYSFYIPNKEKNRKEILGIIKDQIPEDIRNHPIESEVYLKVIFYLPIPKSFSQVDRELAERKYIRPIVKPDNDNLVKTYMDALKGIIWIDDAQVIDSREIKYYSSEPKVRIIIKYRKELLTSVFKQYKKNAKNQIEVNKVKKEIKAHEKALMKHYNMLERLTKDETIEKYKDKIKQEKSIIKSLQESINTH